MYLYVRILEIGTVVLTKKQKQHASQGDDASAAEAAPGRVGRGGQGEVRRAYSTPNGGFHLALLIGRLRLKTWPKADFVGCSYHRSTFRTRVLSTGKYLLPVIDNVLISKYLNFKIRTS